MALRRMPFKSAKLVDGYYQMTPAADYQMGRAQQDAQQQFANSLTDYGVRETKNHALVEDNSLPFGQLQQITRNSENTAANAGYGFGGAMQQATAAQPRTQAMTDLTRLQQTRDQTMDDTAFTNGQQRAYGSSQAADNAVKNGYFMAAPVPQRQLRRRTPMGY